MAAARSGSIKTSLWAVRALQLIFAIILTGIFAWFHNRLSHAGSNRYDFTDVPLGFSVAAIIVTIIAIFTHFFLSDDSQIIIVILDFLLFVGFIASAVVYRHNYSAKCGNNQLVRVFSSLGSGSCNTVRLAAALLILQILLFFASTILSDRLGRRRHSAATTSGVREEKGRFGFGRSRQRPAHAV